jgi:hypothetical protein
MVEAGTVGGICTAKSEEGVSEVGEVLVFRGLTRV